MDEADLLRERLQAITDKRKLQEDIVKKKLEIEEEKLKLQYLKKKSLREQWLMDGLSPQSEQEQEAMKLQVLNEQKQAGVLQRNIHRIEKEIEALESRELTISENEMLVLQRLKEVEKTAADIIKKSTAREKQTNGNELREGSSDTQNQKQKEQKYFPQEVTMETSQLSEMATVRDHKMDSGETEVAENKGLSEEAETAWSSADSSESRMKENVDILTDLPQWTADNEEQHSLENGKETDNMYQKEALILETEHNYLNRTESMTSSVSDTTSSAGTVCENEMLQKTQEQSDQERSDTPVLPTTEDTEESEATRTPEPVIEEVAMDNLSDNRIQVSIIEDCIGEEASSGISTYLDPGDADLNCILRVEIEPVPSDNETDERWRAIFSSSINREDDDSYMDEILNLSAQELFVQKVERNVENIVEINQSDDKDFPDHEYSLDQYEHHTPDCDDAVDQYEHHALDCEDALEQYDNIAPDHEDAPEQYDNITPDTEDVLDHYDNLTLDHDDALDQYEHPSPDGEDALDQYDNLTPDHEDTLDQYEHHNPDHENALDQYEHHITDLEDSLDQYEHHIQDREDILDQYEHHDDYEFETQEHPSITPSLFHGLSKISEDEEEFSHGLKCNTNDSESSKVNTNKKVPPDYCVIQETKSENVSTEHVDFRVARKQWLKMEEETKYQIYQPTFRQRTCQGGHNSMYTPVRNINRSKKEPELDSTALNDYSQTHLSPCSEDSGLDDSSYRSPCDDESPIEREIRLAMEREENLRRERGISKVYNANECTQATGKPVILQPGKIDRRLNQEIEERRKMFEAKEDNCRFPKSPSIKTPSFIITSSPSKGQLCQEVSGNSVIILEPEQYPSSPTRCKKDTNPLAKRANEWPSDVSNVVILEAPAMITRSSSEFCLNSVCQDTQDSTFLNNPFFKLRSRSTQSLIDDEIKMVKQREEELKKQRESIYAKDKCSTTLMSPNALDSLAYNKSGI
uniref:Palmdelphin n=1 Tax=Paramormyrops kingsleyae TaxID=1676925 RepID=A0A3B3S3E2_9TELE